MQDTTLEARLRQAESERHGSYDKRTEHLDESGRAVFINRLILEDSPYLLQHAHNPVNWFPWGDEAFEIARQENKPVFLSIGYSTCHWCHVMEVESFDDIEVAQILNAHFISIKMDREQYPDIDEIYMTGVQLMSGHGGWPMSSFLLPDGKPFFGATYFPRANFIDLLQRVQQAWQQKPGELEQSADSIDKAIRQLLADRKPAAELPAGIHEAVATAITEREDKTLGGLAGAPKFPQEPLLLFMLDHFTRSGVSAALDFCRRALTAMGGGGIYDQVGGGFHRYSVDAQWLVPHFEKMLYNQSQLGQAYLQAWLLTGDDFYRRILGQTLDYVLRDMQIPEGGFYSATDADSEGAEGIFFLWTPAQLAAAVSEDDYGLLVSTFSISETGNFEGANILSLSKPLQDTAADWGNDFYTRLDSALVSLYEVREQRPHPLRDDKCIVAWNGAMIETLARASWHCQCPAWLQAAERAMQAIRQQNLQDDSSLLRISLAGTSSVTGQLEDYANLIAALIALFDVTRKTDYLCDASDLTDYVLAQFYDAESATLFLSPLQQQGPQLVRSSNAADGATLSAVATMLDNLLALARRQPGRTEGVEAYATVAGRLLTGLAAAIQEQPLAHTGLLRTLAQYQRPLFQGIGWFGEGRLRVQVEDNAVRAGPGASREVELQFSSAAGWHVSVDGSGEQQALQIALADKAAGWQLDKIELPVQRSEVDAGRGASVAALGGDFSIPLTLRRAPGMEGSVQPVLSLTVQLCEEGRCLLPESIELAL